MTMAENAVVIVGAGMMTAVGLTAAETAASVRASTMLFSQSQFYDRRFAPFTLAEVLADGLPTLAEGTAPRLPARQQRLLRLAAMPLGECLRPLGDQSPPLGLSLALPELSTTQPVVGSAFVKQLSLQVGGRIDPRASDASHRGRAGSILAIGQAILTLQSGRAEFMVAGGVDSYRDPHVLGTLDLERRVKSRLNLDGFIPGEGAGFLLLTSVAAAARHGLPIIARTSRVAAGFETGHLHSTEPYRGDGLAMTFQQLFAAREAAAPVAEVYSSMNGESHWAKEWGVGYIRNKGAFDQQHGMHHPADCYGDVGAASGPVMAGLAALGIHGGYRRSTSLVYGSSDDGARAAMLIQS
jgi:3-oxoacyl-[acyl-carrier-protein] synthase-1